MRCYFTAIIWYHYSKYTPPLSMLAILESSNLRDSNMQAFYSRQYATFFDTQNTIGVGSRFTAAIQIGGTFMKIKNVAIKNFRGYSDEINSDFEDLTAFVGKNDIGKSTILEALDIFFNDGKGVTRLDKADLNVESKARQETDISIRVCFTDLPEKIVIDATNETSLSAEYLLNSDGLLEVVKRYPNAGAPKVFICAMHPTNPECADLLSKKDGDLRKIIETRDRLIDFITSNEVGGYAVTYKTCNAGNIVYWEGHITLCTLNDTVSHRYTGHTNDRNNSKFSSADAYYAINLA